MFGLDRKLKDGYWKVPPGRLASVVTYLEMTAPPVLPPPGQDVWPVVRVESPDLDWYRKLYRAVGEPWLWFSRLRMTDAQLASILHHPAVEVHALRVDGADKGLLELDCRTPPDIEIQYFGVTPDLIGRGAGSQLMRCALERAWSLHPRRLHLHTCTLDHPGALKFYLKWGFRPWKRAVEVAPDPRLTGDAPPAAAPHIPLISGAL